MDEVIERLLNSQTDPLAAEACVLRDRGHGRLQTYSPKVFIPPTARRLTN
jgi:hypothetical protein